MEDQVKAELDRLGYWKITINKYLKELNRLKSLKLNKKQFKIIKKRLLLNIFGDAHCGIRLNDDHFVLTDVYVDLRDPESLIGMKDYIDHTLYITSRCYHDGDDADYEIDYRYPEDI